MKESVGDVLLYIELLLDEESNFVVYKTGSKIKRNRSQITMYSTNCSEGSSRDANEAITHL